MNMLVKYKWWFIGVTLMVGEAALFMMLLPDSGAVVEGAATDGAEAVAKGEMVEKELGKFTISNVADPAIPLRIDCTIFAAVAKDDEFDFDEAMTTKQYRVKEVVSTVIRRAEYDQLQEASLVSIKRQIKEAVTDILGRDKTWVHAIIIPEFKTFEI